MSEESTAILALDLGTHTGWAAHSPGVTVSGVWSFQPQRFEGGGMRYLRFARQLREAHKAVGGFDEVYFEEVRRHLGTTAAHVYGGLLAVLTAWCEGEKIPYRGVPVGTVKKHATGHGNASKSEMVRAARVRGWNPADDNEADALWILDWALNEREVKT